MKAKYQYTHFIYPFVVENKNYVNFINSIVSNEKDWNLKIHQYKNDNESYEFFLPYMRKFLFPTLFWDKQYERQYKMMSNQKKSMNISKLSCTSFEYKLLGTRSGNVSFDRKDTDIDFEISTITLICFKPGICFLDIKTEIDESEETVDFDKVLDFNNSFRNLTPKSIINDKNINNIKSKGPEKVENVAMFINSIIDGFETKDLEKIYYDKMFTYSYACVDSWNSEEDFAEISNDFYKFQYVMDSSSSAIFNKNCSKLSESTYSKWQYSIFGFSVESGVVLVSDKEKYNITRMPYNFEKKYLYMLLLAFYQRVSLIDFLQDILKKDKTKIKDLNSRLTKFTHFSWFSQITNSDHGMDVWENWKKAFKLDELFDEVHKEYLEYYNFLKATGQEKFNLILIIMYIVNIVFGGLAYVLPLVNTNQKNVSVFVLILMIISISSYPIYTITRWIKHKLEKGRDY